MNGFSNNHEEASGTGHGGAHCTGNQRALCNDDVFHQEAVVWFVLQSGLLVSHRICGVICPLLTLIAFNSISIINEL